MDERQDKNEREDDSMEAARATKKPRTGENDALEVPMEGKPRLAKTMEKYMKDHAIDFTGKNEHGDKWEFCDKRMRGGAMKLIKERKQRIVLGTMLNNKGGNDEDMHARMQQAIEHAEYICALYGEQIRNDRFVIHVHDEKSSMWKLPAVQNLERIEGMMAVTRKGDTHKTNRYAPPNSENLNS